jgi:hypothetical protein
MQNPANLQSVSVNGTTGGINTFAERNVLAAPAAGQRYRIWKIAWAYVVTADATPTKVRIRVGAPVPGSRKADFSRVGFNGIEVDFPGGWTMPAATAFSMGETIDTAGGANRIVCTVWFTEEEGP